MKKLWNRGGFLLAVLAVLLCLDLGLRASGWVRKSGYFALDDFEITQRHHPEQVWDGVIFGSSELISAYREDLSETGYVNLGLDYGTLADLYELLDGGYIEVGSELIVALNWGVMWDELDTDPTYIWHKGALEPYLYFQRDRLAGLLRDDLDALLRGKPLRKAGVHLTDEKEVYHGHMTAEQHTERLARLERDYFSRGREGYDDNLRALERVIDWCAEHGLKLRAVWMPENPDWPLGELNEALHEEVLALLQARGVPVWDMRTLLGADCFYDTGHLEYDAGAPVFTKEMDRWIASSDNGNG